MSVDINDQVSTKIAWIWQDQKQAYNSIELKVRQSETFPLTTDLQKSINEIKSQSSYACGKCILYPLWNMNEETNTGNIIFHLCNYFKQYKNRITIFKLQWNYNYFQKPKK